MAPGQLQDGALSSGGNPFLQQQFGILSGTQRGVGANTNNPTSDP